MDNDSLITIIGAGPAGLIMALSLAKKNIPVCLIDKKSKIERSSKAICFANHNLQLFNELGAYEKIKRKGIVWENLNIYHGDEKIVSQCLKHNEDDTYPAYLNLQQYYLEEYLREVITHSPLIDFRLEHELLKIEANKNSNHLEILANNKKYKMSSKYIIAADGVHSLTRNILKLPFEGDKFHDKFLIVDFEMMDDFIKPQRWFWFDGRFNPGKATLMLKQPDDMWRIDFQIGANANIDYELEDATIMQRLQKLFGEDAKLTLLWKSIYTFRCRRLKCFRHKNVFFIGDAAHQVSPFGARGANGAFQDAKSLAEKFNLILNENAGEEVLDLYNADRVKTADENMKQSYFSTNFISPQSQNEKIFRDLVLETAKEDGNIKLMINTGRLSMPEDHKSEHAVFDEIYHLLSQFYRDKREEDIKEFNFRLILSLISLSNNMQNVLKEIRRLISCQIAGEKNCESI